MKSLAAQLGLAALAVIVLTAANAAASSAAFPMGGGEYHAIFAYSHEGRLRTAVETYAVYVTSLGVTATALLILRFPLRWWATYGLASGIGLRLWWGICTWEPQSPEFHRAVMVLLLLIPLWIALPMLPVLVRRRLLPGQKRDLPRDSMRPSPWSRILAVIALAAPYTWFSTILLQPLIEDIERIRWRASAWEDVGSSPAVPLLDPQRGVVFAGNRARSLLAQCTRPTPGWVVGTWTPSADQIAQLEMDLARFLARNDTGRTRPNGFVMPSLTTYYHQYGGITLLGGRRLIYVNGLVPGFWTEVDDPAVPSRWQSEAISVCGGWQAYYGVEYDPERRRFRGFSYNPEPF